MKKNKSPKKMILYLLSLGTTITIWLELGIAMMFAFVSIFAYTLLHGIFGGLLIMAIGMGVVALDIAAYKKGELNYNFLFINAVFKALIDVTFLILTKFEYLLEGQLLMSAFVFIAMIVIGGAWYSNKKNKPYNVPNEIADKEG